MAKTLRKRTLALLCLILFSFPKSVDAQEDTSSVSLISFLQKLERNFEIKFSYADDDIRNLSVIVPKTKNLKAILADVQEQTQLQIQKLNQRYYTITRRFSVDICGIVLDNFERNTVTGATVEVLGTKTALITDADGYFAIGNVPQTAKIQIKHIGYKTLFVDAKDLTKQQPCATLLLAQFYQPLKEVVVYEFLTQGLVQQLDGSIEMNSEQFGILPGLIEPDVLQTVRALPGIESIDETVSNINIRGGTNDQNLVLWNGIKMYQSGHFFGLISAFNPYLTDQVILTKNGTSSRYGEGVSGIIDIRTKDSISDQFYGGAGVNLIGGDVYGHLPISDKLALQVSARRSLTDILNTPTYQKFFTRVFEDSQVNRNGNFYFYDFTGKLLYDINKNQKVRLSFISVNNLLEYSEADMDSGERTRSDLDQTNLSFGGSLRSTWNKKFSTFLNVYNTDYNLDARNTSSNAKQTLFQNNQVEETALKLTTKYQMNDRFEWDNGYQFIETAIANATDVTQPPFQSDVRDIIRSQALFSEITYQSSNRKLFARGGVRVNHFENPDSFKEVLIEPRLSLNYALTRELKFQILGEFKSQGTNQIIDLEQNFLGIEKRRWIVSDGDKLPITKSKQAAVGFNYNHQNLYIGLEAFYKEVNGISTTTQGFQNQNQFNGEIGNYDVKGIEFLINKKTDAYSIWASYGYNVNSYYFPDIVPSEFPNNLDIRHTGTLAGTYTSNNLKFSLGLNYHTGKPITEPQADDPIDTSFFPYRINYRSPNANRLPEYLRADASAIYNFDIGSTVKATAGVSVLNFTNRKNILNAYYRLDDQNEIEKTENISLGLTPNVSFRVAF
ncbi:Outer membrane receptor proteins, mostly Fe transport [Pricia antarctica]|uniref:Outer membrane receptor proteins, mostly Fe transport n=1 Tax=Pricia antarctica TaxID=641691 RepID=A0A1G7A254_9FLAO|nr:carboxypeptidase-like regulatory domain-containing protein [Pricia antarctica]SDE08821.1 Outer membrane receptor proteins, mostly Fe transport [Pricia antarctica]